MITLAINAAREAGRLLREGFANVHDVKFKEGDYNIVTEMDELAQKTIIAMIRAVHPEHAFLAEETGAPDQQSEYRWIIDPLDGTVNYAHGLPIFCVSIGLEVRGVVELGAIYHPMLDELFTVERGRGAFLNGKKISVSPQKDFKQTILVTGFPYDAYKNPHHCIDHFVDFIKEGRPVRRLGSAALDLAYVACGRFDGFWEVKLNPWDVAAGSLMVLEAGGTITTMDDTPWTIYDESVVATSGNIHRQMMEILLRKL